MSRRPARRITPVITLFTRRAGIATNVAPPSGPGVRILATQRKLDECVASLAELHDELAAGQDHLTISAVEALLTRKLEAQAKQFEQIIDRLEKRARRREWVIGTVVALIVGIASILITRHAFGI